MDELAGFTAEIRKLALDRLRLLHPHLERSQSLQSLARTAGTEYFTKHRPHQGLKQQIPDSREELPAMSSTRRADQRLLPRSGVREDRAGLLGHLSSHVTKASNFARNLSPKSRPELRSPAAIRLSGSRLNARVHYLPTTE
jgi:hypothetical protein